jgi:hypothetical protein
MSAPEKLTRDQFRTKVFERDKNVCVVPGCGAKAADAHHVIERACWLKDDPFPGGYLMENGASLCEPHHIAAEEGHIPPQALRHWLDLGTVLPQYFDPAKLYDKWGNEIRPAVGTTKFPKTPYLTFSPTADQSDRQIDTSRLVGKPLVLKVKMDGSNAGLTREKVAARNGDRADHPSFGPLKAYHAQIRRIIPEQTILFGEWLFARHSIPYVGPLALPHHFLVFDVYDQREQLFWGWDEVVRFCGKNGLHTVPAIGTGQTFEKEYQLVRAVSQRADEVVRLGHEGVVVRSVYPVHYTQFADNSGKWVRESHIQTDEHWKRQQIVKNEVKGR